MKGTWRLFFLCSSQWKKMIKKYAINRKKWLDYSERKTRRNQLVGAVNKRGRKVEHVTEMKKNEDMVRQKKNDEDDMAIIICAA